MPKQCLSLSFYEPIEWEDLRRIRGESEGGLILTKSDTVLCWGQRDLIDSAFEKKPQAVAVRDIPADFDAPENLYLKGFIEEAMTKALARGKPLLCRENRTGSFLIADAHAEAQGDLQPLFDVVGKPFGEISGLFTPVTEFHPEQKRVGWAEAVRVSLASSEDRIWLQLDPDIWVWPPRARYLARDFLDRRRSDRLNQKFNALLDAWVRIVLGTEERNTEIALSAFDAGKESENPVFGIGSRTAFTRRLSS